MRRSTIGGQAVMEGVMMRAPHRVALSVRRANGKIDSEAYTYIPMNERHRITRWPIIRGVVNFVDMMALGMKTLTKSADMLMEDELEAIKKEEAEAGAKADSSTESPTLFSKEGASAEAGVLSGAPRDDTSEGDDPPEYQNTPRPEGGTLFSKEGKEESSTAEPEKKKMEPLMVVATVLAVVLALSLFFVLPTFVANWIRPGVQSVVLMNLLEGAIRLAIFIIYLSAVSAMKDIRRVFMYHGAEHKVVDCYEKELPLDVEHAKGCSRLHPRCGTNYLFLVMMVSILIFSLLGWSMHPVLRVAVRLAMLPVVAGVAYEVLKLAAKSDNIIARIVRAPGLFLQRLTTREPEDKMIEVALTAFNLAAEEEADSVRSHGESDAGGINAQA